MGPVSNHSIIISFFHWQGCQRVRLWRVWCSKLFRLQLLDLGVPEQYHSCTRGLHWQCLQFISTQLEELCSWTNRFRHHSHQCYRKSSREWATGHRHYWCYQLVLAYSYWYLNSSNCVQYYYGFTRNLMVEYMHYMHQNAVCIARVCKFYLKSIFFYRSACNWKLWTRCYSIYLSVWISHHLLSWPKSGFTY